MEWWQTLQSNFIDFFSAEKMFQLIRSFALLFAGIPLILMVSKGLRQYVQKRYSAQQAMIAGKIVKYVGVAIILISALNELGFQLTPLLGAAGVIGVAIGFASQTSFSNLISGVFLLAEQPFVVGDLVEVGGTTGVVLSIDMLSVKLRTFDNRFVRVPNETVVKSQVINITHFPIRRIDLKVGVAYKEDVNRVRKILLDLAARNPLCLQEPEPLIIFSGFGTSSIDLIFAVWAVKSDFLALKNSIQEEIKTRFDQEGVEIPFPHVSFYTGSATQPLQVELSRKKKAAESQLQEIA